LAKPTIRKQARRRRAQRFPIEVPLCYRALGDSVWRFGTSANMSSSGLLFVGDMPLEPQMRLEVSFELPVSIPGERGTQMMCRGTIARSTTSLTNTLVVVAATIDTYRLVRISGIL
jgi:hypothetical protein